MTDTPSCINLQNHHMTTITRAQDVDPYFSPSGAFDLTIPIAPWKAPQVFLARNSGT